MRRDDAQAPAAEVIARSHDQAPGLGGVDWRRRPESLEGQDFGRPAAPRGSHQGGVVGAQDLDHAVVLDAEVASDRPG
jgi:hypothetical protein